MNSATLGTSIPQAPSFSLATLRSVLAQMQAEYPERAGRLVKASNIVAVRSVERGLGAGWWVQSECDPSKEYWVFEQRCTCQDYKQRGGPCKHALAVELFQRCERREAEANDPTVSTNVIPLPERAYSDEDRFELTPLGMMAVATVPAGA